MTAAIVAPSRSKTRRRASRSLKGTGMTVSAMTPGMPRPRTNRIGIVPVAELRRFVRRDQGVVVHAVVLALELDDAVTPRERPRHAHGMHRGLGARDGQAGHLAEGHLGDQLAGLDLVLARQAEADASREPLDDVRIDALIRVPEDGRAVAHAQVDELVAVQVPDAGALATVDVDRVGVPDPEVRVGATGHRAQRATVELGLALAREGSGWLHGHAGSMLGRRGRAC